MPRAKLEYSLFRVSIIKSFFSLFDEKLPSPQEAFVNAVKELPSAELRANQTWHLGNLRMFSPSQGYFAVGRTTLATTDKYDEKTKSFRKDIEEESPHTHCVFDSSIGILAVAKRPDLSQSVIGIAKKIQGLLISTDTITDLGADVDISPIQDPKGFIRSIKTAYRVYRFRATFRGPNPTDADEYFNRPLSQLLAKANGQKGSTTIAGDNLDRDTVSEIARSTAATGNKASARIQRTKKSPPVTVNLEGDPVSKKYLDAEHEPEAVIDDFTETYRSLRNDENYQDQ